MRGRAAPTLLAVVVAFGACAGTRDPSAPSADAGGTPGADAPPPIPALDAGGGSLPSAIIGAFDVKLVAPVPETATSIASPGFTAIQGRVSSGPRTPLLQLDVVAKEGDCRLLVPTVPFCDPPCRNGVCATGGICVPNPEPRNVGTVLVEGVASNLGAAPVSMPPEAPQFFYQPDADVKLAFPPFAEGAQVRVVAMGAELPGFAITGKGIGLLETTSPTPIPLDRSKVMALRWQPPLDRALARIEISLDISHHGGFKGEISCNAADSGSLDIAASLIGKLIDLGVAGYPTVTLTRRASAQAQLPSGRVELNVTSERLLPVVVAGYTSCNEDEPCPDGKVCQPDLTCK